MTKERVEFRMQVLGRMLELLGSQMYKRRDTAIAELVANAWDAGAPAVDIVVPTEDYDPDSSEIVIDDNGCGMDKDDVQSAYMVVGRNRRVDGVHAGEGRKVMGRKGIGKLAGFGIARIIEVETLAAGKRTTFAMDMAELKLGERQAGDVPIEGTVEDLAEGDREKTGTVIRLKALKHATPPDIDALRESLGRRFSRVVHGEMVISVNGEPVGEPAIDFELRVPQEGLAEASVNGDTVRYFYGFSRTVLRSNVLRGFTLHANGKTAQAPPFYFGVEATASGQHGTRYMYGVVEIDYLDDGTDDESDLISTDRQEIDWESPQAKPLLEWGDDLTRRALRDWASRREDKSEESVLNDSELSRRIERLDSPSKKQLIRAVRMLGGSDESDGRLLELASSLVAAFEYRHFHDVVKDIEKVEDPDELATLLGHLAEWKVLESRAILEIVKGRLQIIEKFHSMLVDDAPETAPKTGMENLHDLIANYPWLLDPEWQVLYEEKTITKQLREWAVDDIPDEDNRQRYDFLALTRPHQLLVIEIKRAGHAVVLKDLQRLQEYRERLRRGNAVVDTAFVSGPEWSTDRKSWEDRPELLLLEWSAVHERTRVYYEQYRAVLEADVEHRDFAEMEREVSQTRGVLERGAYRGKRRVGGLGPQYVAHIDAPIAEQREEEE